MLPVGLPFNLASFLYCVNTFIENFTEFFKNFFKICKFFLMDVKFEEQKIRCVMMGGAIKFVQGASRGAASGRRNNLRRSSTCAGLSN